MIITNTTAATFTVPRPTCASALAHQGTRAPLGYRAEWTDRSAFATTGATVVGRTTRGRDGEVFVKGGAMGDPAWGPPV